MNVLITGAARGLGLCLVKCFADRGHQVYATVRNFKAAGQLIDFVKSMKEQGKELQVHLMEMDVTDWNSIVNCALQVEEECECMDVVINNAGVLYESDRMDKIMETQVEVLRGTIAVNVEGPILVLKAFYKLMLKSTYPKFYVITSEGTMEGNWDGIPIYSLSKVAANKAVGIISVSVPDKFQVLAIHPGRMDTDMGHDTAQITPDAAADGIYDLAEEVIVPQSWYVNYLGDKMKV